MFGLAMTSVGCVTVRGRADDALAQGDYRHATELYGQVLADHPNDPEVKRQLIVAERGLLDEALDRANAAQHISSDEGLRASLEALETADRLHAESIDEARRARLKATVEFASDTLKSAIKEDTSRGRALAARARRTALNKWLARRELAALGPELDLEIAAAGVRTCERATKIASEGDQPFSLELVASYCKDVGGPLPGWKARPLLVSGVTFRGAITGTPEDERAALERVAVGALERSVWYSAMATANATLDIEGSVSSTLTAEPTEIARSWVERVPYQTTETYREPVQVPYTVMETYTETLPYTTYEAHVESCSSGRGGMCSVSRPVTRTRDVTRTRPVTRFRTEWAVRSRIVTRVREVPRVFRFKATKHAGHYQSSFVATMHLGPSLAPIVARDSREDARVAYEHDAEFAPAGVSPERGSVPSATTWRQEQRERLGRELLRVLDVGWTSAFCNEAVGSLEEAARCAHGRPQPAPSAVRTHVAELFGDDPELVLALPRPREAVR